jgi:transposase
MQTGQAAPTYALFVGVDIAATTAAVSTQRAGAHASRSFTIDQTPEGYTKLGHQLQATGHAPSRILVVMEATGSYWISLATHLVHEGFVVSVINRPSHYFAKALLKRAKTDAIDAQTLAQLAMVLQPEPWKPLPPIYYALQQRLAQRDDLLNLRQQVTTSFMPCDTTQRSSRRYVPGWSTCWWSLRPNSPRSRRKSRRRSARFRVAAPPSVCKYHGRGG